MKTNLETVFTQFNQCQIYPNINVIERGTLDSVGKHPNHTTTVIVS